MKKLFIVLLLVPFCASQYPQNREYKNLNLNECINIAKENNKQKQIAETKLEVSESQLKQAESGRWPSLELTSKAFIQDEPQNFLFPSSTFNIGSFQTPLGTFPVPPIQVPEQNIKLMNNKSIMTDLTLLYPVFTGGKISSIIDQVENNILISKNNVSITESDITLNVKRVYYAVVLTRQLLKIGSDAFERFEATYNLTESLYQTGSGTVNKLDFLKNKMSLETFRGIVSELRSKNELAISGLKYFLGLPLSADLSIKDSTLEILITTPNENAAIDEMLSSNLYLKNLDIAKDIYESKIDESKSDFYPSFVLFGNYHRLDNSYDSGFATKQNKNVFTAGIGLQLSLFNGFRTSGKVEENEAELKGIQLQKLFVEESLKMKLNQLITELKKNESKIVSSKEAMIAASENRELNLRAYQNEIGEVADFIEAQIMESIMMAQYQISLYERVELTAQLESLMDNLQ